MARSRGWVRALATLSLSCSASALVSCGDEAGSPAAPEQTENESDVAEVSAALERSVSVAITQDTSIRLSAPNKNFGSSDTLDVNRALVKLEASQLAAAIAPGDYLISARLELTLVDRDARRRQLPRQVGAYRMRKDWTELGATWLCAVDANPANARPDCAGAVAWQMAGSDAFVTTPTSMALIPASRSGVVALDVTSDVRAFLSGAAANQGWMLKTPVGAILEIADLASGESSTPPRLILQVRSCGACDDANPCTVDGCDSTANCIHLPADGLACEDGNACTQGDRCQSGACAVGAALPAGAACGTGQVCDGPAAQCVPARIVVNEVESNGGTPGDWVELFNAGSTAVDVSSYRFKDNDDTHAFYTIPSGTVLPAGGFLVLEEAAFGFGLGGGDSARLYYPTGDALVDTYAWTTHATTTYGRCPDGSGAFATTTRVTKGAVNDCSPPAIDAGADGGALDAGLDGGTSFDVVINEVESNGGTPGDWVELFNAGSAPVALGGYRFKDNDDTHAFYTIPAGTTLASGAFLVLEEAAFGFGLGGADNARLFAPSGDTPVATYAWTAHATTSYGRCPNGAGEFTTTTSTTKGAPNDCGAALDAGTADGGLTFVAWPGPNNVSAVDLPATFTTNLSGLTYQSATASAPAVLWAVQNSPSLLYRLAWNGGSWVPFASDGWSAGKLLVYPNGSGGPDSEGVTRAEPDSSAIYVATERDNNASGASRLSILRFDTSAPGSTLIATHEWNVTSDLPAVGANLGLEAITWIPDSYLVASGFRDASTALPYDPAQYPNHGSGAFLVGVEATGTIYAFVLDHVAGGFRRIAAIASGQAGTMGLEFDRDRSYLWAYCDDTCGNRATVLTVDTDPLSSTFGQFRVRAAFDRPSSLPNTNHEGIAIAPESECVSGFKSFYWADDSDTAGQSIRRDAIPCAPLF